MAVSLQQTYGIDLGENSRDVRRSLTYTVCGALGRYIHMPYVWGPAGWTWLVERTWEGDRSRMEDGALDVRWFPVDGG